MSRSCLFTGKRPNTANSVSHSNRKTKKRQFVNLQSQKVWWTEGNRFVQLRLSTRALRSIDKLGLERYASEVGIDLSSL
jgi:large subunit ribosomal protein L28